MARFTFSRSLLLVSALLFLALFAIADGQANFFNKAQNMAKGNKIAQFLGIPTLVRLQKEIAQTRKCNVRLCFAIDGSGSMTGAEYKVQQDLVKLIASLTRAGGSTFSAVQYGLTNIPISAQTGNIYEFRKDVDKSFSEKATRTFVGAGLGFCAANLHTEPKGDGRKIVFLGDGRSNFFTLSLPLVLTTLKDIKVFAVGVGFPRDAKTLLQIAGNKSRVCAVNRYSDVHGIVIKLLRNICPKKGGN